MGCRQNQIEGQINLRDAIKRNIAFTDSKSGKQYQLKSKVATLMVRPRGLHLPEKHIRVDDRSALHALLLFRIFLPIALRSTAWTGTKGSYACYRV